MPSFIGALSGAQTREHLRGLRLYDDEEPPPWKVFGRRMPALTFDRAADEHPITSNFGLFERLPIELLSEVAVHLTRADLAALAQVDRDCRQLARSYQFTDVVFDYSPSSMQLLEKLIDEGIKRTTRYPVRSISACVRRMTISTGFDDFHKHHDIDMSVFGHDTPDQDEEAMDETRRRLRVAERIYDEEYLPKLAFVIQHALVHLEVLEFYDISAIVTPSFMQAIANAPIQHLKLYRQSLPEDFKVPVPSSSSPRRWCLRTLYLSIVPALELDRDKSSTSTFCTSLITQAAPTLEQFHWTCVTGMLGKHQETHTFDPSFSLPSLRYIETSGIRYDDHFFDAIYPASPSVTSVNIDDLNLGNYTDSLNARGTVPSLKSVHFYLFPSRSDGLDKILPFITANPQLAMLSTFFPSQPEFIDRLLPILHGPSFCLKSLYLVWNSETIKPSSFEQIGSLSSLRQLYFSAGEQDGWRYTWFVDHTIMRRCLSGLKFLRRLVLRRDTYLHPLFGTADHNYYSSPVLPPQIVEDILVRFPELEAARASDTTTFLTSTWEAWHLLCMRREAQLYVDQFPELDFILFGMRPMSVEIRKRRIGKKRTLRRVPVALTTVRDECSFLRHDLAAVAD